MKKIYTVFALIAFLFAQGSCFAVSEKTGKKHTHKNIQINKEDYINKYFWKNYNDPNLEYFISRTLESNHDLKLSGLNTDIYKQYISVQRAGQLPTIGAGFSPAYSKMPMASDFDIGYSLPIYVNYEADIFLKNRDKTLLAKKDYEMSILDEKSAYISAVSVTGTVYFNILKLNKIIELQEEIVSLREEIYRLMKLSNEKGLVSIQDVIQTYKSYLKGKSDLNDYKKMKAQTLDNLAVLIGENPDNAKSFIFSDIDKIQYKGEIPSSILSETITSRPDYQKAALLVEKSGIDIRVAKKEFLPSFSITGLSLFNSSSLGSLLTTKSALMSIGASAFADLFSGGRKFANLKIKKTQYQKALVNYEKTNLTAIQEVNDALSAIKFDNDKYIETKKQNELEETDYNLRTKKFNQGVISKLELLQANENLLSVKKLLYTNKTECFIDNIGLYKATGGDI